MKSLHDQIAHKCVHFNGMMNKACNAGVIYDELDAGSRVPYRKSLPCLKPFSSAVEQCACEHLRFPTEEEVQARLDYYAAAYRRVDEAQKVIEPIRREHKGKDWDGMLECPTCKGRMYVSHCGYNNHVHVKCETPDCTAWVE